MRKSCLVFTLLCVTVTPQVRSSVIVVPVDQPTIQLGIAAAADGDTILVEEGIYNEQVNFLGKNVFVTSRFIFDEEPSIVDNTVIDVTPLLPFMANEDSASAVMFISGEGPDAMLAGFTITGGQGTVGLQGERTKGGGVFVALSSPRIKFNIIKDNEADDGGGVYLFQSQAELARNIITGNTAEFGGGVRTRRSEALILNNTIDGNVGTVEAGGIFVQGPELPVIRNNIVSSNQGHGISTANVDSLFVDYNNVYGNTRGRYGDGNVYAGPGQIDCNPRFVDREAGDFMLQARSPCIDAGDETYTEIPPYGGDRIDIGGWEYLFTAPCEFMRFYNTPTEGEPCDTVYWDVRLTNSTDSTQVYDVWVDVSGPKCKLWDYIFDLEFPPNTSYYATVGLHIPCCAKEGLYVAKGKVGVFDEFIFTGESFEGTVIEGGEPEGLNKRRVMDDDWWVEIQLDPRPRSRE